MAEDRWESAQAWQELSRGLVELADTFLTGPRAAPDEAGVAAGTTMLATLLGVGFDTYLFPDTARPVFVELVVPHRRDRRWGGDNTDAGYHLALLDPARTYRVRGRRHDAVYLSLSVYNQPSPGAWSDRIVGVANDLDLDIGPDGSFELVIGPERPDGWAGPFIGTTPDTHCAVTRDYLVDPTRDRATEWHIECLDDPPTTIDRSDARVAAALRATLEWMRTMFTIVPMPVEVPADDRPSGLGHETRHGVNEMAEPYQVGDTVFGWSAIDACYSFGSFSLRPDEALVITHTPPACRFWNLCVWNEYMAGTTIGEGRTSINGAHARAAADGTVTIVVAREQLVHPNAVTTLDLPRGMLAFRWFVADTVPTRPTVEVVRLDQVPTTIG